MAIRARVEGRVLAALRMVDALGRPVRVTVTGPGLRTMRKAPGVVVILSAAGPEDHVARFEAPGSPSPGSVPVSLDLRPCGGRLMPRGATLAPPRSTDANDPQSVFRPVELAMPPR